MADVLKTVEAELERVRENNIAMHLLHKQNIDHSKTALKLLTSNDVELHWDLEYEHGDDGSYYASIENIRLAFTPAGTDYRVVMVFASESLLDDEELEDCNVTDALGNDADEDTADAIIAAHALNTDTLQYKALCNVPLALTGDTHVHRFTTTPSSYLGRFENNWRGARSRFF